uniref:Uncharacterized protein n=1 Tax=Anopheles minimus TaxID=112268 RepID=A0A182VTG2_9DIPT
MSNQSDKEAEKIITYGTPTLNDWKIYLRNLQQNPSIQNMATPDSSSSESSFELEESFKALLDRKRREMQDKRCEERLLTEDADVASREVVAEAEKVSTGNDSTFFEQDSISRVTDTSFEEMERICAVLDKVNGFDTSVQMQEDTAKTVAPALHHSVTLGDVTQLEDIDEPSGLWENTVLPSLSPVKRMHLLRPSTILEESAMSGPAEASKNSSIETYISAGQVAESVNINSASSGSDVFRTAQETFETDSYARSSMLDMDSGLTSDFTGVNNRTSVDQEEADGYSKNSTREADSLEEEQNVIVLDSSESDIEDEQGKKYIQVENESLGNTFPLDSMVSGRDESLTEHDEPTPLMYDDYGESTHNYPDEVSVLDEMPDRFNDTLEETDFMMKQGLKLLALKKQQQQAQEQRLQTAHQESNQKAKSRTNSGSDDGSRPMLLTPAGKNMQKATPQGSHFSYLTPTGGMSSRLNVSHGAHSAGFKQTLFASAGKNSATKNAPIGGAASVGSFKKPVSRLPQLKVTGRKFDHIVSPIGAYIKKTPQSMLQTKINCHNKNLIDVLHGENRDSAVSAGSNHGCKENQGISLKGYTSSLPGKGVISSNRAHVLDERNVVRIPGGEKMQKLINGSPTMVIRHEGRIKFAEQGGGERKLTLNMSAMTDDSLADLSVLSSDVMSMSTLARMFQMIKGSPVAVVGGAIVVTGSVIYTYRSVYRPFALRRERAESEAMANYIFQMEQAKTRRQINDSSSNGQLMCFHCDECDTSLVEIVQCGPNRPMLPFPDSAAPTTTVPETTTFQPPSIPTVEPETTTLTPPSIPTVDPPAPTSTAIPETTTVATSTVEPETTTFWPPMTRTTSLAGPYFTMSTTSSWDDSVKMNNPTSSATTPSGNTVQTESTKCAGSYGEPSSPIALEEGVCPPIKVDAADGTMPPRSYHCGWFALRPRWMERFMTPKWALFWLCWAGAVQ